MKKTMIGLGCLASILTLSGCKQEVESSYESESQVGTSSQINENSIVQTDELIFTSEESEQSEKEKELSLTTEEVKNWVKEVLVYSDRWREDHVITTTLNQSDNMLYSYVGNPQLDYDYVFRINSKGELQAKTRDMTADFTTVSTAYSVTDVSKEELIKVFGEAIEPPTVIEDKINSFDEAVAYVLDNEALWNQSDYKIQGHREDEMASKLHSNEIGEHYSVSILIDKPIYPQLDQGMLSFVVYKDGRIDQQIKPTGIDFMVLLDPKGGKEKTMVNYSKIERYD